MHNGPSLLDQMGLDERDLSWQHLAACDGLSLDWFFEEYEIDPEHARSIDAMCLHCPVIVNCLREGVNGKETGVWGGVYLTNGKMDPTKNQHKTKEIWGQWEQRIRE